MSILKKGLLLSSSSLVKTAIDVLTGIILSRMLLPEGVGQVKLPFSIIMLLVPILTLGIGQASIFILNSGAANKLSVKANSIKIAFSGFIILGITSFTCLTVFNGYFGEFSSNAKFFLSLAMSSFIVDSILQPILFADLKAKKIAIATTISSINTLALYILFMLFFKGFFTINSVAIILSISKLITTAIIFKANFKKEFLEIPFSTSILIQTLLEGRKFLFSNFVEKSNSIIGDFFIRLLILDFTALGLYMRANSLGMFLMIIPVAVGPLLYSKWSGTSEELKRDQLGFVFKIYLMIGLIFIFSVYLFSDYLVPLIYGKAFTGTVVILKILCWGILFRVLISAIANYLSSIGKAHVVGLCSLGGLIVSIILNLLLVPIYEATGAAISFTIGSAIILCSGLIIMFRSSFQIHHFIITIKDVRKAKELIWKKQ